MKLSNKVLAIAAGLFSSAWLQAAETPRWVSAGGSLSEWVVVLGGESRLVGVDSTSRHPASLTNLANVGYQRALAAEGILSLRPDLLLGSEEMGPPPVLEQLRGAGVKIAVLPARADLNSLHSSLQQIGDLLGDRAKAEQAFTQYQAQLSEQAQWVKAAQAKQPAPGVLFLIGHAGGSPMAGGKNTLADWIISQAGGRNLATQADYKVLSTEALIALDPEVVVLADRQLQGEAARAALLKQNPALAQTRAGRSGRLWVIDPTLLIGGLGPRLPAALSDLAQVFYPSSKPSAPSAKPAP
ncbi:hemin ABC transporter substrate-binding protein [Pseudomonas sp. 5P_3.1_Bac2]|uniref:heme/hemin ABC transporter substrate-binding protein n=1 Tax=Pseudomonas sp. 5P_3.1_Bac2 TaxID=2971617 RepID=UPI0021C82FC7|nr:ABC transporter substrate-binding protein [Pseudomonas sp. 5P_3.1_Bac2]MCU1718767.1 ABC transporter substrate-binding protein [Pseudomonas sp. 5P_3.1_Bac2]